jgi:hypothetical protein
VTDKGSVEEGGGAGGGTLASTTSGGVAVVSGATLVSGLESDGWGIGVDATGTAAFTVFCSHPVVASANPVANSTNKAVAFLFRLGIYLFFFSEGLAEVAEFSRRGFHGASQRQFYSEGSSAPDLRIEFYPTIV